ncbi:glycosyltransferase family A protein [Pyxidicoccus sp. MSG2]|uniref:glycosyltransferase family A protein n=1 Tax=Pyxidicoccus sp. MSG2 TaxID=2996790 RepID=UPI00226EF7C0|nr:glycosyltransferase family A protein [Pyxidicoccus sp. MSG2]MCY1022985.1 glycosyltransferase family A protein [Pyxidicoccus sp. MSG2]
MKVPQPFFQLANSLLHPTQYDTPLLYPWRTHFLLRYLRWQHNARFGARVSLEGPQKLCVILLAWKRLHNMQPIVRSLLRADFVDRIIVSNNNPEYRIADWVTLRDERLRLVDQPRRRAPGLRFELARDEGASYFMSIDDDVFLYPEQVKRLFAELLARPQAPHGIQGERFVGDVTVSRTVPMALRQGWQVAIRDREEQVDVINTVYTFTAAHVEALYQRAHRLGIDVAEMSNGEDLLLSASGTERPYIHDVGQVAECLSSTQMGVSTWRTRENFFRERTELFKALQEPRSRESA